MGLIAHSHAWSKRVSGLWVWLKANSQCLHTLNVLLVNDLRFVTGYPSVEIHITHSSSTAHFYRSIFKSLDSWRGVEMDWFRAFSFAEAHSLC